VAHRWTALPPVPKAPATLLHCNPRFAATASQGSRSCAAPQPSLLPPATAPATAQCPRRCCYQLRPSCSVAPRRHRPLRPPLLRCVASATTAASQTATTPPLRQLPAASSPQGVKSPKTHVNEKTISFSTNFHFGQCLTDFGAFVDAYLSFHCSLQKTKCKAMQQMPNSTQINDVQMHPPRRQPRHHPAASPQQHAYHRPPVSGSAGVSPPRQPPAAPPSCGHPILMTGAGSTSYRPLVSSLLQIQEVDCAAILRRPFRDISIKCFTTPCFPHFLGFQWGTLAPARVSDARAGARVMAWHP
jgi:hypothetical protein